MERWTTLLCAGLLLVLLPVLVLWLARLAGRVTAAEGRLEQALLQVREEMAQVSAQCLRVSNQQRTLDRQVQQVSERLGRLELRGEGRPFEQAITMLRGGSDQGDLVSRLGLSESEASLLVQLHRSRRAAAAPRSESQA